MKLSTGKVAFPIEFDNGEKEVIYFNPHDRGIQERIKSFENSINEKLKQIDLDKYKSRFENTKDVELDLENPEKLLEMSPEELQNIKERLDVANQIELEYNKVVRDELDSVFASKISDVAFKYCEPFDTVIVVDQNGNEKRDLYIMHFLNWLMIELKKYGAENKSAMDKHLAKYSK